MIVVTRLNDSELMINATLIETLEATPDTVISLVNGKKIVVKESVEVLVSRIQQFYQSIGLVGTQYQHHAEG